MIQFLNDRLHLQERINQGIDVHLTDAEAKEFERLAVEIKPSIKAWSVAGCIECANKLVKFVFDNQGKTIKRETFPKENEKKDKTNRVDEGEGQE